MKKFRFKYSPIVWVLMAMLIVVCTVGLILNAINIVSELNNLSASPIKKISSIVLLIFCALVILLIVIMMIKSEYIFKGENIVLRLGIFSSKIDIGSVLGFIHGAKSKTLALTTNNEKTSYILIDERLYGEFIAEVKKINANVFVSFEQE